jgi:colicin import membrane protein
VQQKSACKRDQATRVNERFSSGSPPYPETAAKSPVVRSHRRRPYWADNVPVFRGQLAERGTGDARSRPGRRAFRPSPSPRSSPPPPEPPKPEPPKPEPPKPEPPKPQPKPEIATKAPEPPKPEKKPEPKPKPPEEPPLKPIDLKKLTDQKLNQEIERRDEVKRVNELLGDGQQGKSNQRAANPGNPGELDAYKKAIADKVRRNLNAPPGLSGNPSAVFEIEQIMGSRGGEVINVKLKTSSGNHALDEATERAIRKSSPLPLPDDPALFKRRLDFVFYPLGE